MATATEKAPLVQLDGLVRDDDRGDGFQSHLFGEGVASWSGSRSPPQPSRRRPPFLGASSASWENYDFISIFFCFHTKELSSCPLQALLKVIRHCESARPALATGSLLGLTREGRLEVTLALPLPSEAPEEGQADEQENPQLFQFDMLTALKDVRF